MCSPGTDRYDRNTSTSQSRSDVVTNSINFGEGQLLGTTTTDKVCLSGSEKTPTCLLKGFTFFEITSMKDINLTTSYSGILGIAPDDPTNGPSFLAKLKTDNYINEKVLALLM